MVARTADRADDDPRQLILDTAVDLFIEQGYAGTSIRDISARARKTKGSLYYYFRTKEDLLTAMITPMLDGIDELLARHHADGGARSPEQLERLVEDFIDFLDRHGVTARALMTDPSVPHNVPQRESMLARLIALEHALARSDDPAALLQARMAIGAIHSAAIIPPWDELTAASPEDRTAVIRRRLTAPEKRLVLRAAMGILANRV